MSQLYVDNIRNRTGGPIGIPTGAVVTGVVTATTGNITGNLTVGGNADITGVLTYEDVTNVDSVGIITAQSGVSIADSIFHTGDTNTAIRFPAADTFTVETAGSERLRIASDGDLTHTGADNVEYKMRCGTSSGNNIIAFLNSGGTTRGNITYDSDDNFLLFNVNQSERVRIDSNGKTGININNPGSYNSAGNELVLGNTSNNGGMTIVSGTGNNGHIFFADGTATGAENRGIIKYEHATDAMAFNTAETERLRITSTGGVHFSNAELIERVNIVGNKLSAATSVNLDNGMVHYYTTNETTTANPNIITTAGINTNMATGDTMSVTIMSKPNGAGYFPRISIDGRLAGITTYWSGGDAPSSAESSGVDVNTYQIIKTADETFDVLANTSNFA
jgi:hypothetical protein